MSATNERDSAITTVESLDALNPVTIDDYQEIAAALSPGDWELHRTLAQRASAAGFAAEVAQEYDNDAASEHLSHETTVMLADSLEPEDEGIRDEFDAMGGSLSVEQFSPDRLHGYYGQRTPVEHSPAPDEAANDFSDVIDKQAAQAMSFVAKNRPPEGPGVPRTNAGTAPFQYDKGRAFSSGARPRNWSEYGNER